MAGIATSHIFSSLGGLILCRSSISNEAHLQYCPQEISAPRIFRAGSWQAQLGGINVDGRSSIDPLERVLMMQIDAIDAVR